jgi:death on curing protein
MDEPQWIADRSVLDIHDEQLQRHGGLAGVRDAGLLASALYRPRNLWNYARDAADLSAMAAAYASGIARNHPFIDGNKRTAAVVCEAFIELNGHLLIAGDDDWYNTMIGLASGALTEEQLADWIRSVLVAR